MAHISSPLWSTEILCSVSFASELLLPEGSGQDRMLFSVISDLIQ